MIPPPPAAASTNPANPTMRQTKINEDTGSAKVVSNKKSPFVNFDIVKILFQSISREKS